MAAYPGCFLMMNKVREYYNNHFKEEDIQLQYHVFEFPLTMYFIRKYLDKGFRIFDTACGTGHYAKQLLKEGFLVGLNDISDENIEAVRQRLNGKVNLLFAERNDIHI